MADAMIGNKLGVAAKSVGSGEEKTNTTGDADGSPRTSAFSTVDAYDDIGQARARLTAINGTLYTAAYLNQMTYNDMIYAIRLNDAAGTI